MSFCNADSKISGPIFEPHPPHLMISALIFLSELSRLGSVIRGSSVYRSIKRLSIYFFNRHNHSPQKATRYFVPIAIFSPKEIRLSTCFCGEYFSSLVSPRATWRRFFARIGPCLTANTPDFGRLNFSTSAISPTAKIFFWPIACKNLFTLTNPVLLVWRPQSPGHVGAEACVAQIICSTMISSPTSL